MTSTLPHTPPSAEMSRTPELREASLEDQRVEAITIAAEAVARALQQKEALLPAVLEASRTLRDHPAAARAAIRSGIAEGLATQPAQLDRGDGEAPEGATRQFDERELHRRATIEKDTVHQFRNSEEVLRRRALALAHSANSSYFLSAGTPRQPEEPDSGHDY